MTFSATAVSRYTEGDCWGLAWHLHALTGWDIVVVTTDYSIGLDKYRDDPGAFRYGDWDHMAVRAPDGRILDVKGWSTAKKFAFSWYGDDGIVMKVDSCTSWSEFVGHLWGDEDSAWYWGSRDMMPTIARMLPPSTMAQRVVQRYAPEVFAQA